MTKQIRLCLPARWDGIRSVTALRTSEKENHRRSENQFFLSERPVVAHSGNPAGPQCAVTLRIPRLRPYSAQWPQDTTAKGPRDERPRDERPAGPRGPQRAGD